MKQLDQNFIDSALKVTSFNLSASDFTTLKNKKEIQYLFSKYFFPNLEVNHIESVCQNSLNKIIAALKAESKEMFKNLHSYNIKGFGPGEISLYFMIDTCYLGGGNSAGIDAVIGKKEYEVKAIKVTNEGCAVDFKLGGTVPLAEIINDLNNLRTDLNLEGRKTEISSTTIRKMKELDQKSFSKIETNFRDIAFDGYFKNHEIIFINNSNTSKMGNIESVKKVNFDDISIERITSGTVKPKVKL